MGTDLEPTGYPVADRREEFPADELFAASSSAVLLADGATGCLVAVNPAALVLLDARRPQLQGRHWYEGFDSSCAEALQDAAERTTKSGTAVQVEVKGRTRTAVLTAAVSRFYSSNHPYLLIRLAPVYGSDLGTGRAGDAVQEQLDALSSGFILTDGALCIEFWNRSFLTLVGESPAKQLDGESLLRWLNLTQTDLDRMREQMALGEATSTMVTSLCAGGALLREIEVTAVAVPDASSPHWGFIVRRAGQRPTESPSRLADA